MHAKYLTKQCTCPTGPFGPCDSCKSTTDAARLREAAQRLFSADSDYWFAIDHKPIAASDAQLLAHHVLATVLEDAHSWRATTPGEPHEEGAVCNKCGKYATSEGNQPCE